MQTPTHCLWPFPFPGNVSIRRLASVVWTLPSDIWNNGPTTIISTHFVFYLKSFQQLVKWTITVTAIFQPDGPNIFKWKYFQPYSLALTSFKSQLHCTAENTNMILTLSINPDTKSIIYTSVYRTNEKKDWITRNLFFKNSLSLISLLLLMFWNVEGLLSVC